MSARAGGDEGFATWHERLALATQRYSKVVLVGDSMVRRLPLPWQRFIGSVTLLFFTKRFYSCCRQHRAAVPHLGSQSDPTSP